MQTIPGNNIPATEEQRQGLSYLVEHHYFADIPKDELSRLTSDRAEEMISAGKRITFAGLEPQHDRQCYREFRLFDAILKAERYAALAKRKADEIQSIAQETPTAQNLNAAAEAGTAAEKARETATGMLRYIELESQAVRHGDQFAAENAVCEAERDSEYTHELVNALTEIRQKKVSAEKP